MFETKDSRSDGLNQYLSGLSEGDVEAIVSAIGPERFATYRTIAGGDTRRALHLYELNARLSAHMHEVIGGFEIALRNTVSRSVAEHYHRADWYRCRDFVMKLSTERRENIRNVRHRIRSDGHEEQSGRVIAGLTFHFWVALHENKYRDTIWTPHLHRIWPIGTNIKVVHKDLLKVRDLRNRIAHHEPVFAMRWSGRMDLVWLRLEELVPEKASWYRHRCETAIANLMSTCAAMVTRE